MLRNMLIFLVVLIGNLMLPRDMAFTEEKFQDIEVANRKVRLIGKLHEPFGKRVKVQGIIVEGESKGTEHGPNIVVQRIDGKMTQEFIQIKLHAIYAKGEPEVTTGKSYELEGYETGGFAGICLESHEKVESPVVVQSYGDYFRHSFIAIKNKPIEPLVWSPADFIDRKALLAGKAENIGNDAYISTKDWKLLAQKNKKWPDKKLGKEVEGFGTIRKTATKDAYSLENGTTRLVRLEDQLGENVELRGRTHRYDDKRWINYRGTEVYLDGLEKEPDWSELQNYLMRDQINGILEETTLSVYDLSEEKLVPKKFFVVRKPTWKKIEGLLTPEVKIGRD